MDGIQTRILGFDLPSNSPLFLSVLSVHVFFGLASVILGIAAMLSVKRSGKHPRFGTAYYWCLFILFATATVLAVMRWSEDYHLFILGALSFVAASVGRIARRQLWRRWVDFHHRYGAVVHSDAYRLLRGQWQEPARVERSTISGLLGIAGCGWNTADSQRARSMASTVR